MVLNFLNARREIIVAIGMIRDNPKILIEFSVNEPEKSITVFRELFR